MRKVRCTTRARRPAGARHAGSGADLATCSRGRVVAARRNKTQVTCRTSRRQGQDLHGPERRSMVMREDEVATPRSTNPACCCAMSLRRRPGDKVTIMPRGWALG